MKKPRIKDCLDEIEARLRRSARSIPKAKREERARFMKSEMPMIGLTVPMVRSEGKRGFSFSTGEFAQDFAVWELVWKKAAIHEVKLLAIYFLEAAAKDEPAESLWPKVQPWAAGIACWDMSDGLSGVYSAHLETIPDTVYPVLEDWNRSDNPWERRQSLVSLFFYTRFRKRVPPLDRVLPLVEARLGDEDYYVQKGLGWCLRECYAAYPGATDAFIEHNAKTLAPAAWQAATEKLPINRKMAIKQKRKA